MELSTKMRYGARALVEMAATYGERAISTREIAKNQRLSVKYLEQIMSGLKAAGLVRAVRGLNGGYELARPPASITLVEIFQTLEGSCGPVPCVDHPESCPMEDICPTRDTWVQVSNAVRSILSSTTLADLAQRKKKKLERVSGMYYI